MADVNVADELVLKINAPRWRASRSESCRTRAADQPDQRPARIVKIGVGEMGAAQL